MRLMHTMRIQFIHTQLLDMQLTRVCSVSTHCGGARVLTQARRQGLTVGFVGRRLADLMCLGFLPIIISVFDLTVIWRDSSVKVRSPASLPRQAEGPLLCDLPRLNLNPEPMVVGNNLTPFHAATQHIACDTPHTARVVHSAHLVCRAGSCAAQGVGAVGDRRWRRACRTTPT